MRNNFIIVNKVYKKDPYISYAKCATQICMEYHMISEQRHLLLKDSLPIQREETHWERSLTPLAGLRRLRLIMAINDILTCIRFRLTPLVTRDTHLLGYATVHRTLHYRYPLSTPLPGALCAAELQLWREQPRFTSAYPRKIHLIRAIARRRGRRVFRNSVWSGTSSRAETRTSRCKVDSRCPRARLVSFARIVADTCSCIPPEWSIYHCTRHS